MLNSNDPYMLLRETPCTCCAQQVLNLIKHFCEYVLHNFCLDQDGSFMVRCSTAQNARQPFTLVVLFNQKVYNIPVRFLKDSSSYALGKEGKKCEEVKVKYFIVFIIMYFISFQCTLLYRAPKETWMKKYI